MDILLLSRLQFAFTTAFHILFPTLTIGLAVYLVIVELFWLRTKKDVYYRMYRFWVKIFAIHFAVGVVTGITLEFQFGTNFALFSKAVANIIAPLMAYEGMTAFFLESGFLGIMLFGWNRVPPALHFFSTCMVALGASLSAFWIIMAANAWMQTPSGYSLQEGTFIIVDFYRAVFSPALFTHLSHMLIASYETTAFAVAGISAFFLLRKQHLPFYRHSLALALVMAALCAPLQVLMGDLRGLNVAEHQPAKLAAIEAHWETNETGGAPFVAFAVPDMDAERNHLEIAVPNVLSFLITHSWNGKIMGLQAFPKEDRPNATIIFWTFRIMVAIGFLFFFVMVWAAVLWYQRRIFESRSFLRTLILIQPLGWFATLTGWATAEVGRQPWVVYGVMRTADGVSPIATGNVVWSLSMFGVLFTLIGISYFYFTLKTITKGPDLSSPVPSLQRGIPTGGNGGY